MIPFVLIGAGIALIAVGVSKLGKKKPASAASNAPADTPAVPAAAVPAGPPSPTDPLPGAPAA